MNFLTYLEENESFSSSQYLASIGAGTEPFTGMSFPARCNAPGFELTRD